jgi:hypothetical protein
MVESFNEELLAAYREALLPFCDNRQTFMILSESKCLALLFLTTSKIQPTVFAKSK